MRRSRRQGLAVGLAVLWAAVPSFANRLTLEVWPDASPDHVVSCTFSLSDGWISLVHVRGVGMPGETVMRWRASTTEVEALTDSLQALVGGRITSVDPYGSRQPPAPFLSVTWMTRLDNHLATGLYLQPGLALPDPLSATLGSLDLGRPCGLSAKAAE
jgi:hypothetical protein